jgi:nucleotide-binding universal stress UspA family protein
MNHAMNHAMNGSHRLLVPYDFSVHARAALSLARELAGVLDADLHLLHVVPASLYVTAGYDGVPLLVSEDLRQQAEDSLRDVASAAPQPAASHVVESANVVDCIVLEAERLRASMIVMGTHGRGSFARLLLGSVTDQTLRRAPCPVLTVRAPCDEDPVSKNPDASSESNPASEQLETLSDALARLERAGFRDSFHAHDGRLRREADARTYEPEELVVEEIVRFEGESDPADSALLFALSSHDGRARGTFVAGYGTTADEDSARVVRRLAARHAAETRGREHLRSGNAPSLDAK